MMEAELYEELKEAREAFENIRSILIHTLQGPGRAAFWQAVTAKNRINAILAEPDHLSEDEEIAFHTGRGAYRNGRSRTENPYASMKLRDAWFEGYDGDFDANGDWNAMAHVRFLRDQGGASSGFTADLIENLYQALRHSNTNLRHWREQCGKLHSQLQQLRQARGNALDSLAQFANGENWTLGQRFDPNSARFDGVSFARRSWDQLCDTIPETMARPAQPKARSL